MKAQSVPQLALVYLPACALVPNPRNARTHSKHQIRQIAASIREFGFTNPVLIDHKNTIIAGHGRVEAAKLEGIEQVPTILLENLTEDEIRAYVGEMTMQYSRSELEFILRRDLMGFIVRSFYELNPQTKFFESPHIEVMASKLEACRQRKIKRLIVNMPPRALKSHAVRSSNRNGNLNLRSTLFARTQESMTFRVNINKARCLWAAPS